MHDLEWYHYVFALLGSVVAGGINTLAGNGSVITLSLLTEMVGLPGNVANGTNRIGVLMNGMGGLSGFLHSGKLGLKGTTPIVIFVVLGSLFGALIAMHISDEQFMNIFKFLMVGMFIVILVHPSRWMIQAKLSAIVPEWVTYIIYFILGMYGGLIHMGIGIFFLGVLVLLSRYPIMEANAIKVFVVTIYTLVIVVLFHFKGMIDWPIGVLMGVGQFAGGWFTAKSLSGHPKANRIAYFFLVTIMILSLARLFHII
jgi:uncharacterized membrane protein YfcA